MVFWGKGGLSNTHHAIFSSSYYYLEELLTYRTQPLSLFPGTVVCSEKQMTVYWTRNVIISFLSPRCGSREDTGQGALQRLFPALQGNAPRSTAHVVCFSVLHCFLLHNGYTEL